MAAKQSQLSVTIGSIPIAKLNKDDAMYYFSDSPVVLTDLPSDHNSYIAATDDCRLVAVLVSNMIYFHCQKSNVLLCRYRHNPSHLERYGNLSCAAWNSSGNVLLLRTDLGFLCLLCVSISEIEQLNHDNSVKMRYEVSVKSVNILKSLGQFSCCVTTCNKIIAGNKLGRVICLNWLGEVLTNEGFDLHSIPVQSEIGINAVISHVEPSVNCLRFHWAPTLGGFLVTLTNGCLLLVILPLSVLDSEQVRAVYLTQVELYSPISVNSRFRSFAVGSSNGQITSYHIDEMSNALVISQKFHLPDPVRHGIDKMPGTVKTISWSPDGYCLAAAWSPHGMALWSVFGSLLYSTLLDQAEVTRFLAPLNFCWTLKGFYLWTISSFVDDPDRREREEYLNAFRERLLHSCNALPQTQRQIAKNMAKMRSDLHLDDSGDDESGSEVNTNGKATLAKNRNFLMVFRLAKSALATNPTGDNHLHLLMYTADSIYVTVRRFLHSRRNMLNVPLPPEYIRTNFPLKFAAMNPQGSHVIVAGSRGFALCVLSTLQCRLFGNITQEQAFEVHAGLAWWGHFICFCAFNYAVNRCEIRCYPCTEKLDDRFASILPLDNSIRPLVLDVVGNRLIVFSTDSHYRSFDLTFGSKPHEVVLTPHSTYNLSSFFPYAACLTRVFPFSLHSNSPITKHANSFCDGNLSQRRNAADPEDTTLLVTYAGNLLLLPNLHTTSLIQPHNENGSVIAEFFGFGLKKDTDTRKYRDTFSPTLIASRVELLWSPTAYVPLPSPPQRPTEFFDMGKSDSESEEDAEVGEVSFKCGPKEEGGGINSSCTSSLLGDSIWLFCGADGMRIWLPLDTAVAKRSMVEPSIPSSPNMEKRLQSNGGVYFPPLVHSTKASRRVMISLGLDGLSYPLVIFLDKAVLVTVQSDYLRTERSYSDVLSDPYIQMPFYCTNFKTNLFLPHLLKDLLRKNLSDVAFELASAYRHLPYFQHILELLLHEVLEEEATSKFPIPDPLLPQVTAFIEQFPHFLDVVVQCTRKTEVTWWRHLFCSLGRRPKDLFDHALSLEQLDTAASCLVILQNSESQATCKQSALLLLETAIKECQWHHVKDLMRFLKATTLSDKSTDDVLNEVDAFFERVKCRFLREGSWKCLEEIFSNVPSIPPNEINPQNDLMESSDLQSSLLSHWLLANREHVAIVDDWPRCFQRLHSDFGMFLPLVTQKEGVLVSGQKRPGFARAVNGDKLDSFSNLEVSPHCNLNDEAPTFHRALRTQRQLQKLLSHLLLVLRELKPSSGPEVFTPPETSLFSWTLLIAILQLDKQAVLTVFSFLQNKCEADTSPEILITFILQFLNGLESLESLISANPRANPEYFGFFVELKPRIRKFVQPLVEPKPVIVNVEGKSTSKLPNGVILEQKNIPASKASPENHISMSISVQTIKTQNHVAADFESSSDDHLVHPGIEEEGSRSSCIVS
ncbi:unnamed protein product [Hymenolepis diminuta]|uniref:Protein RIC1 homolog n=3 Tax=Hymenolepis diminuta TaxID=6216 RepID=A0A564YSI3_HYMDI|nr:unnamed protein product [Hymenolepis diminuta]